ncbi:MAG: OmpH family outer membrane protein [Bacteroidales bacterium]|nr:OmpH family outer membrane protein [Bacteroidales bacterium]
MKKILLITALVFATVAAFGQKFGRISSTELIQLCPEADKARSDLQVVSQEAQDTYKDMVEEFNKKYNDYQQNVANWSASRKESAEKDLDRIRQNIQEYSQNVQNEIAQKEQELFQPIYEKANDIITKLGKKYQLVAVFEVGSLPYIDEAQIMDLTPEARKEMGVAEGRTLEALQAELQAQQQQQQ